MPGYVWIVRVDTIYGGIPWVLALSALGALLLAGYAWRRRRLPGAEWLASSLLAAATWVTFDLFNYLSDLPAIEVASKCATWALILAAGFGFFRFAIVHAGREHWWRAARIPIALALGANLLIMLTNGLHGLLWPGVRWVDVGSARVPWLESGPAFFWLFRPVAYGVPLAGVLALVVSAVGTPRFYGRQIAALAIGAVAPIAANLFLNSTSVPGLDLTPVAVICAVVAITLSALRYGLLDIKPLARSLLLEQLDDGVVVLDPELRVLDLNPAAQRLLQTGDRWQRGVPASQMIPFWRDIGARVEAGDGSPFAVTAPSGAEAVVIEVNASVIRGEDGASLGRFLVLHDVTARARLIRELDSYAQAVASELKSPLSSVTRLIVLARGGNTAWAADSRSNLGRAESVCRLMQETVEALLQFAQLRSLQEIVVEPLDMSRIVAATLERLSAAITRAGAEIAVVERWPGALGHARWVEEIWTNYVSNAIKYGGVPPRVEVGASNEGEQIVRFWVRDNGPGLNEQQRQRLFTEFARLEPRRSEGHGLGLSIVQRIAEKLGGRVGCESAPGKGSTFWFTLPAA